MKFFSNLIADFKTVTNRFPILSIAVILNFIISIFVIELVIDKPASEYLWIIRLQLVTSLSISLLFAIQIMIEKYQVESRTKQVSYFLAILSLIGYYFLFQDLETEYYIPFAIYAIVLHLNCSIAPFISFKSEYGFWRYNQVLFIRFFQSALFSLVLYLGLLFAIFAIKFFLSINISDNTFGYILSFCGIVFNTFFFLAGVPNDWQDINNRIEYPNILKVFAQYILVPLSILYLVILYAYGFKILIEWKLPDGLVALPVIVYFTVGVLAMLFVFPLRDSIENTWIKFYTKYFYILLIPLDILMFVALMRRVMDYGITELRYFGLVLVFWILFIALMNIFSKKGNIKIIPISLIFVLMATSFGPWGAFSISENSQTQRYINFISKYNIIKNKKLTDSISITPKEHEELFSISKYLFEFHNGRLLIDYLDNETNLPDSTITFLREKESKNSYARFEPANIFKNINILAKKNELLYFDLSQHQSISIDIIGYEKLFSISYYSEYKNNGSDSITFEKLNSDFFILYSPRFDSLRFDFQKVKANISNFMETSNTAKQNAAIDEKVLSMNSENKDYEAKFITNTLIYNSTDDSTFSQIKGTLLIKRKGY